MNCKIETEMPQTAMDSVFLAFSRNDSVGIGEACYVPH